MHIMHGQVWQAAIRYTATEVIVEVDAFVYEAVRHSRVFEPLRCCCVA